MGFAAPAAHASLRCGLTVVQFCSAAVAQLIPPLAKRGKSGISVMLLMKK
jgi:hypothetical protein